MFCVTTATKRPRASTSASPVWAGFGWASGWTRFARWNAKNSAGWSIRQSWLSRYSGARPPGPWDA